MPIKRFLSSVVLLIILSSPGNLFAWEIPTYSVDLMCYKAPAIIEGTYLGQNNVRIAKIYKKDFKGLAVGKTIQVVRLSKHTRKIGWKKTPLKTNQLVIFLTREKSGHFESYGCYETGSSGVHWYDKTNCYAYQQMKNPGPPMPYPATKIVGGKEVPKTIQDLRSEIKIGLKNFATWNAVIRLTDPKKKAIALSKYLLKRTSPKNDRGTYRRFACEGLATLKKHSLPVLMDILKNVQPKDQLDAVIETLSWLGPKARPAVPMLCKLLNRPQQFHSYDHRNALRSINDPRTISLIRPFLKHKNPDTTLIAAQILGDLKDQKSFEAIHALLPKNPQEKDLIRVRDLLYALCELNVKKSAPIIDKMMEFKSMTDLRKQFEEVMRDYLEKRER